MPAKKFEKELKAQEDELQYEDDSNEAPPKDVFTFNELRSCADLFRLHENKILDIQPYYQRDIVWPNAAKTKFIDSVLKNLPIPSLCFSLDIKTGKMQVIDGLQRISTLCQFLGQEDWTLAKLEDVDKKLSGKSIKEIREKTPKVISDIENIPLPITLLRCDHANPAHSEYIFTIFRRLNTGGMKLTNQEIRNAVYSGSFNDFLKKSNLDKGWATLVKKALSQGNKNDRLRSTESLLKFFAFYEKVSEYDGKLAAFLNSYMQKKRNATDDDLQKKKDLLDRTISFANARIFNRKQISKMSMAVFEALLYGIAKNIDHLEKLADDKVQETTNHYYRTFLGHSSFSALNLSEGTYKRQKVSERMIAAKDIFSGK